MTRSRPAILRIEYRGGFAFWPLEANMGLGFATGSESRFSAYVEGLVSVIGHADRAGPLRDYCLGLMMPCERKSVEPMAAVTAPGRTAAQHQSLLHFVGKRSLVGREGFGQGARDGAAGDRAPRADRSVDHRRYRLSRRRASTRSAWRGNIAASSASRTTARSRCRCRLPIITRACRWPTVCICRKTGRRTANVGARRACLRISASRPSPRSRLSRSMRPARPAFLAAWC